MVQYSAPPSEELIRRFFVTMVVATLFWDNSWQEGGSGNSGSVLMSYVLGLPTILKLG